jgi:hypothetical protein
LVEETGEPRENHWPVTSHWQTLSHDVVSSTPRHKQGSNSQLQALIAQVVVNSTRYDYNLTIMEVSQTGHWHYLPTYQILMISDNVEFLPPNFMPCFGSHFENGRHLENFENAELLL